MKLTPKLVKRGISKVIAKNHEPKPEDLHKVTHLHLQRKNISELDDCFEPYKNLTVLYLYDNQITHIRGIESCINIEILHLERNKIKDISPIKYFTKMKKLYLGWNEIELVEHLGFMTRLVELHIENQSFEPGTQFLFDPLTIVQISESLKLLNISGNGLYTLEDIANMRVLDTLIANSNRISQLDTTCLIVGTILKLRILNLIGNPVTKGSKYREKILSFGENIEILDGKDVGESTREFMRRFHIEKSSRLQRRVERYRDSNMDLRENYLSCSEFPSSQSPDLDVHLKSFSTPIISMSPTEFIVNPLPGIGLTKKVLSSEKVLIHPDQLGLPEFELAPKKATMKIRKGSTRALKKQSSPDYQLGVYKDPSEELLALSLFQTTHADLSFILPPRDRGEELRGKLGKKVEFVGSTCNEGGGITSEGDLGGMKYNLISPFAPVDVDFFSASIGVPKSLEDMAELRKEYLREMEEEDEVKKVIPFKSQLFVFPPWPHIQKGRPPKGLSDIMAKGEGGGGDMPTVVKYMP